MSLVAAAREDVGVCCTFLSFICQKIVIQLSYTIPIDRANTKHQPYREAAIKPQLVTPESEHVMLEWMEQSAASGMPFNYRAIRDHTSDLADQHWSSHFAITSQSLHRYGRAINATTGTTLVYYGFSIPASHSVNQINYHNLTSYAPLTA